MVNPQIYGFHPITVICLMTPEGMCYDICTYLPTRSSTNVLWYSFLPSSDRWIAFSDFLSNCQKPPGDGLHVYICKRLWKFPKIGVPLNHPFLEDLPLNTIHFGISHLWKLPYTIYMLTFLALLSGTVKLWTPKNQQHDGHAWCDMLSAGLFLSHVSWSTSVSMSKYVEIVGKWHS